MSEINREDAIANVALAIWHYPNELYTSLNCFENCQELAERALNCLPSAEPEIIRCKDCKHRDEDECPMRYVEWVEYEVDGYFESDDVVHDRTLDDGFCDRWEKDDTDE